jgi:uncharacterized protein YdeI (YjbR/CyaY-like superfamily)
VIPALIVFSSENQSVSEYPADPSGAAFFLEDLFVRESFRRRGIGKALLTEVARIALNGQRYGIHREVLDWNQNAIKVYRALGAKFRDQWRPVLLYGAALRKLAEKALLKKNDKKNDGVTGEIRLFPAQAAWAAWLAKNHRNPEGLWLRLARKGSGLRSVTYAEALEVALCYGWIDGQKRPESEEAWLQRFVQRSPKSIWSKINREKAKALIGSGKMKAAGLAAVEAAKKDGRWEAAYDSPSASTVPEDFQSALNTTKRAREFFESLDRANRYAVLFRIQTVKKAETRARKIREFVEMLERGERIHEPRRKRL